MTGIYSLSGALPIQQVRRPGESFSISDTAKNIFSFISTNKKQITTGFSSTSALANLFTFLNGNFNFLNLDNEKLIKVSNFFARCGTAVRGITGAVDCYGKNNIIPFIGSILEVPTAIFTNGYTLWLARGIPQSIRQIQGLLKRRFMDVIINGEKAQLKSDNFSAYGISKSEGFKYSVKEIGKIIKELFTKPFSKGNRFAHSMLSCSMLQFTGPVIAFLGLRKIGAFLRDLGGVLVDGAYMMDRKYFPGGLCWIISAVADYGKLWQPIADAIPNLTQLSNTGDPIASIFESFANFGDKSDDEVKYLIDDKQK